MPRLEWYSAPVDDKGRPGVVRWAACSFELSQNIAIGLVDVSNHLRDEVEITYPRGKVRAEITEVPFVAKSGKWEAMEIAEVLCSKARSASDVKSARRLVGARGWLKSPDFSYGDSLRTDQAATRAEVEAIKHFLDNPDHLIFVCPHHDIGEAVGSVGEGRVEHQLVEYLHHGDHGIPPRQGFGGFARTLLTGLGVPVENRFGLRPAAAPDGAPAPVEIDRALDELGLLRDVEGFNLHPQSRADTFPGKLFVCDTTLFSSTAGGVESLRRFWSNVIQRPRRPL
jgi:hypothetical protein